MSVIFLLIGISLLVAAGFLVAFLWAASSGQYDDPETPAIRMLYDDGTTEKNKRKTNKRPKDQWQNKDRQ